MFADVFFRGHVLLILLRKPVWDWELELEKAEGREIPLNNNMHPDALFPPDWLDRLLSMKSYRGVQSGGSGGSYGANRGRFPSGSSGSGNGNCSGSGSGSFGLNLRTSGADGANVDHTEYFYKGDAPGFVFGCSAQLVAECFDRLLFGVSLQMKETAVASIKINSPLFLLDTTSNLLFGLYQALSLPQEGIDHKAFLRRGKSGMDCHLPVHVRFGIILNADPVHENDPEVCTVICIFYIF